MKIGIYIRKVLILLVWRLKGFKVNKTFKNLIQREYWTEEKWNDYQNKKLKLFVNHCYNNVPYYKELFDKINLKPEEIQTIHDLKKIPVLTKEIARENHDKLISRTQNNHKLEKTHTSGSTGKPFTIYDNVLRSEYLIAGLWRIYMRSGWKPGERVATIWGANQKRDKTPRLIKSILSFITGATYLNAWKANDEDFKEWYDLLKKQNVKIIVCYASSGSRFARWIIENKENLKGVKGVYTTSEVLYEEQKKQLEEAFQCPVFNLYGCGEVLHIGCSCEKGNIHINPDMAIVETDSPDANGNTPLIVTGLRNYAMPFLRYKNGDSISIEKSKCSCGRNSSLIGLQIARVSDIFKFANGKEYPSLYFILRLYEPGFDGVELFQFHQDKIDHIFLRIVKNKKFDEVTNIHVVKLVDEIEKHIEYQAKVELLFVDEIEQTASLKHYYAKSDV